MLRKASTSATPLAREILPALQAELQRRLLGSASQSAAVPCLSLLSRPSAGYSTDASAQPGPEQDGNQSQSARAPASGTGSEAGARRMKTYSFVPPAGSWPISVTGFPKTALREDILHFLPPMGLEREDIKPAFDSNLKVKQFWIALRSREDQSEALACSGRMLGQRKVEVTAGSRDHMAQAMQTRFVGHSRGRYLLVTGIDSKSSINDVMMMFNRFNLMPIAINIFHQWGDRIEERGRAQNAGQSKQQGGDKEGRPDKQAAVIRLETAEDAYHALRYCNHGFVRGSRISIRVLQ